LSDSSVFYQDPAVQVLHGDVMELLRTLPDNYAQTVVTSPPYWGLRDYQIPPSIFGGDPHCRHRFTRERVSTQIGKGNWAQGRNGRGEVQPGGVAEKRQGMTGQVERGLCRCGAWRGCLGLEPTPFLYVEHVVEVFREVRRVLRDDGTLWLNVGDCYADGGRGKDSGSTLQGTRHNQAESRKACHRTTLKALRPKNLVGIPWRVAFALQDDGWYLRRDIIWSKKNPMPESVTDRPTSAHEYLFLLSKSKRYLYNAEAIAEPATYFHEAKYDAGQGSSTRKFRLARPAGWSEEPGAHTDRRGRYPRRDKQRGHGRRHDGFNDRWDEMERAKQCSGLRNKRDVWEIATQPFGYDICTVCERVYSTTEYLALPRRVNAGHKVDMICRCGSVAWMSHFATFPEALVEPCVLAGSRPADVVLDPFGGALTTTRVAKRLGRRSVAIERNALYCKLGVHQMPQEALPLG
jgi:DNA modification methylase